MRKLTLGMLTGLFALALSGSAAASPTLTLFWSATSGTGTPGGTQIDAAIGDTLSVDVILTIDADGFVGAAWDLVGSSGFTAVTNSSLVVGSGGPPECPAPPNLAPGTCFSPSFKSYHSFSVGVVDAGSSTTGYDLSGITSEFVPGTMTVGRGVFVLGGGSAFQTISTSFAPGFGGVTDGTHDNSVPAVSTVSIIPEPETGLLVASGAALLAAIRRRPC